MTSNLTDWCNAASTLLPDLVDENDQYELTSGMFPDLPNRMEFPDFAIRQGIHQYLDTFRVDYLQISATREAYRSLGLVILAAAFQAKDVWIVLTSEKSDYRYLSVLGSEMQTIGRSFSKVSLQEFDYSPRQRSLHPFSVDQLVEFPAFLLKCSNEEEIPSSEIWNARDTVEGFGRLEPSLLMAELFLDIARQNNSQSEFVLEGPAGIQGVDALSAQVRFWLPGARGYDL